YLSCAVPLTPTPPPSPYTTLFRSRARDPVSAAMHRDVDRVSVWMPVALVRAHSGWQRYHALPVVDEEQRLLGAIRYQTLRRLEQIGKHTSELQSRENLVCRLLLEK